jgi:hypothetical protein
MCELDSHLDLHGSLVLFSQGKTPAKLATDSGVRSALETYKPSSRVVRYKCSRCHREHRCIDRFTLFACQESNHMRTAEDQRIVGSQAGPT